VSVQTKQFILIILDGAGDVERIDGRSPLEVARTTGLDFLAREGISGLMQTLYEDLPKESIVAQLGMLGWDPHRYYPHGRSSFELLAARGQQLDEGDIAFRANLVRMQGNRLESYNAGLIPSEQAIPLVDRINEAMAGEFPDFGLYHNSDFRNSLVVRAAGIDPRQLRCPEPHEHEGCEFDLSRLIQIRDPLAAPLAERCNLYLSRVKDLFPADSEANMLWPWSPSIAARLPSFVENTGFSGRVAVVGFMDFLQGISLAGGMEFFKLGNGRPDTDYVGKGMKILELLLAGYELVVCHVNGPDEAAHMGQLDLKIKSIEEIDEHIVQPVLGYFLSYPERLGAVMALPDHYTNSSPEWRRSTRSHAHSLHPVPIALWNGRDRDHARFYGEDEAAAHGTYTEPVSHMALLSLLGLSIPRSADEPLSTKLASPLGGEGPFLT
jgi:2,3-bisphosphoglycerate-independent phosphoglycerate mutase